MSSASHHQRIGLVAGWGRFPIVVAETLQRDGHDVYCLGIKGHADQALKEICTDFRPIGVAKLGAQIRYFRRQGVTQATMAGKIFKHKLLYQPFFWLSHFPDWRFVRTAYPYFITKTKDRKDDTMLTEFANAFADDGITFAPATDFAPELLVKKGPLTRRRASRDELKDIEFGWTIAKELGRLDVGQSVIVKDRAVLAVEAIEGTDECIRRAGQLCSQGGFTVIKVAKPQQDMRFDVPTIGVGTLETLVQSGGRVLAIEADKTIIIDEEKVIDFANRHSLTVIAIDQAELGLNRRIA